MKDKLAISGVKKRRISEFLVCIHWTKYTKHWRNNRKVQLRHWRNLLYRSSNKTLKFHALTVSVKSWSAHSFWYSFVKQVNHKENNE